MHLLWMSFLMAELANPGSLESSGGPRAGNRALSVTDQIRESILGGAMRGGERLNEVQLSKTLSVSRARDYWTTRRTAALRCANFRCPSLSTLTTSALRSRASRRGLPPSVD